MSTKSKSIETKTDFNQDERLKKVSKLRLLLNITYLDYVNYDLLANIGAIYVILDTIALFVIEFSI